MPENELEDQIADPKPRGMRVRLIEEKHELVHRQAAPAEEHEVCCGDFEADYGRNFRLQPGGGVVPESLVIRRVRQGRESYDRPRFAWKFCPICGLPITVNTQVVVKPATV